MTNPNFTPNEEYDVVPVDHHFHTERHPTCDDPTCPDKDDPQIIADLNEMYQNGLLTGQEASDIHAGRLNNYGY